MNKKLIDPTSCKGALREDIYLLTPQYVSQITGKPLNSVYKWADDRFPDFGPNYRELWMIALAVAQIHKKEPACSRLLQEEVSLCLRENVPSIDAMKSATSLTRCAGDISVGFLEAKTPREHFQLYGKLNEAEDHIKNLKLRVSYHGEVMRMA